MTSVSTGAILIASDPTEELELKRRVENYLRRRLPILDAIAVEVRRGTVILRGTVFTSSLRWRCVEASRHVAGVLNVIDQLVVMPVPASERGIVVSRTHAA